MATVAKQRLVETTQLEEAKNSIVVGVETAGHAALTRKVKDTRNGDMKCLTSGSSHD